jgi:hypothetical protein
MKNRYPSCRWLLPLVLLLGLCAPALAIAPPPPTGPSLAEALNPDGTLKPGVNGSFDARQFRMGTAPDGRPVFRPTGTKGAGDERWQDGFGLSNGANGGIRAVVRSGNDVYIGGYFTVVGSVVANRVAKWNGTAWSSLGTGAANGVNDAVYTLAVASNGDVYAGGEFNAAGGTAANNVAKWNGTAWSPLGTGAANGVSNGSVLALAVAGNGDVYAGGFFSQAGGVVAARVAKWNGTAWSPVGAGLTGTLGSYFVVSALAVAGNGDVYAGGLFMQADGAAASNVAKWNGTAWSSLGTGAANGVNEAIFALAVASNGDVYAGGRFTQAGGVAASHVAKWNGTAWSSLGTSVANGVNSDVSALAVASNGDVYASGYFTQAGGLAANAMARWNGTAWSPLGMGLNGSTGSSSSQVVALAVAGNGDVYVGGNFTQAGAGVANNVAKWTGTAWSPLSAGAANGMNGYVSALAVAGNGDVYVGGEFTQAGGVAASRVAKWNGTAWSSLGAGLTDATNSNFVYVEALAVAANGDVYAGGNFTQAGGVAANNVAKWNGTAWSPLGTGLAGDATGSYVYVSALVVASNGDLYVGGEFAQAGGVAANNVARWNGTVWSPLGTGLPGRGSRRFVSTLAVAGNGNVYAGGEFTQAGGVAASHVAKWNGTAWSPLGTGLTGGTSNVYVYTLAVAGNGDLFAGGEFAQAGGVAANNVARWSGTAWSPLSNGVNGGAGLIVASNGDVYASGDFTLAGGIAANNVAKWNGTAWSSLGTGLNAPAALVVGPTGKLYAGGSFTTTGDGSKVMVGFGIYDPSAPLTATAATRTAPAALYPNPAHGTATLRLPVGAPHLPLTLTDAQGRLVRRYPAPATTEAALDLRGLPAGVYLVRCGQYAQRLVVE